MTRLSVGIDGYNLAMPNGTGVATYGFSLANALKGMGHEVTGLFGIPVGSRPELREVMFFDQLQRPKKVRRRKVLTRLALETAKMLAPHTLRDVPLTGLIDKETFSARLPQFDRLVSAGGLFEAAHLQFDRLGRFVTVHMQNPPDIMHWTYPVPIRLAGARNVYTMHDLVPLRLPYTTLDMKPNYFRLIELCVKHGDHICTVSNASRDDIVARFPQSAGRLTNTYQTSPLTPGLIAEDPATDAAMIEGIFGLKHRSYFLYFGAIEPKKNIGRLIEAYLTTQTESPLVIVGARAWESDQELALIGGSDGGDSVYGQRLANRVIRLDYLPRRLLLRLIRGARAVTFPSLYEGFGLPVHEAMLLGTPVLSSNVSSIPEVAGDAAILVDPYNVDAITAGLRRMDADAGLREELGRRGIVQAAIFSDANYRERLAAMYAGMMRRPPRR